VEGRSDEIYPLSLKDMSTINIIPKLIEAGIDSFKIEGRMKKPEYSAGVTALYRKYIDRYYADPDSSFEISKEDLEVLRSLYQRTGISEGYYFRHNDRQMVTVTSPAYNATSDKILSDVHDRFLGTELKLEVDIEADFRVGEEAVINMRCSLGDKEISVNAGGNVVQAASKRPMDEDGIKKQLRKLGGTGFEAGSIDVHIDDNGTGSGIFVAVSELNDLRREAAALLRQEIERHLVSTGDIRTPEVHRFEDYDSYAEQEKSGFELSILVSSQDQLKAVLEQTDGGLCIRNLYVDSNVFLSLDNDLCATLIENRAGGRISFLMVALPYITRSEEAFDGAAEIQRIADRAVEAGFDGVLVRNLEQLGYLKETGYSGRVITDYSVYTWNSDAALELLDLNDKRDGFMISELTVPYELSFYEAKEMSAALKKKVCIPISYNIYGHIPMMISAGCIRKTTGSCSGKLHEIYSDTTTITDRMNNVLKVTANCRSCYNIIWNPHPTSLHNSLDKIRESGAFDSYRVDFSTEDKKRTKEVLTFYMKALRKEKSFDIFEKEKFTTGHFKRGAE
jgi:putative protease